MASLSERSLARVLDYDVPDPLFILHRVAGEFSRLRHGTEEPAPRLSSPARNHPVVDAMLDRGGHGHGAAAVYLADQVGDDPAALALFDLMDREREQLRATQAAAEQEREHGAIPQALEGLGIRRIQQLAGLFFAKPVPCPDVLLLHSGDALDRGRDLRASRPLLAISLASFRTGESLKLMVAGASACSSSQVRWAPTSAFEKAGRGVPQGHQSRSR